MSSISLIPVPADDIAAFNEKRQSTLYARGKVLESTYDIRFVRRILIGNLAYELVGRVGPVEGIVSTITASNSFPIHPLRPEIIIFIANHPNGVPTKIQWGELNPGLSLLKVRSSPLGPPRFS